MSVVEREFLRLVKPSVHGGIDPVALRREGVAPAQFIDFSSNQSPLGAAPGVAAAVAGAVIDAYPDPRSADLCAALAVRHRVAPAQVVAGNGSTELIRLLAQLALTRGDVALSLTPAFGECEVGTALAGARFVGHPLVRAADGNGFSCDEAALRADLTALQPRLCWLCSPNNPTGAALPPALIAALVSDFPATLFVLDEAYCDLLTAPQWTPSLIAAGNLVVLYSLTKAWGLAGLRLGYALAAEELAARLRAAAPPWNVNACAQAAGLAAMADDDHHNRAVELLRAGRDYLVRALRAGSWTVEPTAAGFFLIRVGDAAAARRALLARGCLVRDCTSFGLPEYVRVSPRFSDQNELLLTAFAGLEPPPNGV